jgi:hypothetical protein
MTDISALIGKADLLDQRKKNTAEAAAGALGVGAFQQHFNQALGVNSSSSSSQAAATVGATGSASQQKVGMAAPQSSVAAYQAAVSAQGSGAQALGDYLNMPLSQKMFYMMLASMGVSKEQYDAMSPADKQQLAAKVEDRLKQQAAAGTDALQPDSATAQGQRFAPVQEAQNAQKTQNGAGKQDELLLG